MKMIEERIAATRSAIDAIEKDPSEINVRLFLARGGELAAAVLSSIGVRGSVTSTTTVKSEHDSSRDIR